MHGAEHALALHVTASRARLTTQASTVSRTASYYIHGHVLVYMYVWLKGSSLCTHEHVHVLVCTCWWCIHHSCESSLQGVDYCRELYTHITIVAVLALVPAVAHTEAAVARAAPAADIAQTAVGHRRATHVIADRADTVRARVASVAQARAAHAHAAAWKNQRVT